MIPDWGVGAVVLSIERVLCDTGTVPPQRRRLCILYAEHTRVRRPPKKTIRSRYVLWWFLCQDKPYGTIILTTISFRAYKDNYKLWIFLSFYIWTLTKLLYNHRSMFWIFGCFDIVTILFFHVFRLLYHVWLCSCRPCDVTLHLFLFITNYPIIYFLSSDQL